MEWKPEEAGIYTIYAIAVGSVGHFGDHYTISEPFVFELTEEDLALFASPNAPPEVRLVSPGPHVEGQAVALARIDESLNPGEEGYGEVTSIRMVSYGQEYTEEPTVKLVGGGGRGASASAHIIPFGSITRVTVENGGKNYSESLKLEINTTFENNCSLEPIIRDGVVQEIPIISGGVGYSSDDLVSIFDLQNSVWNGTGARALLEVDESNGSVTAIKILNGGQNYDPNYLQIHVISEGSGLEANTTGAVVNDGVVVAVDVTYPGFGFDADQNYSVNAVDLLPDGTSSNGSGFVATAYGSDIKDGVIFVDLNLAGEGYIYPPTVILTGGSSSSFGSPFVFAQNSIVTLEAEVFDLDGAVDEVRFYGNGRLLGASPTGGLVSLTIMDPGNPRSFAQPPKISFVGGGPGTGAMANAEIDANGSLISIRITDPGQDYTAPPAVVLTPSNGANVIAAIDNQTRNTARRVPDTNRWLVDWNTQFPGTFNLSVEAIDDESKSNRISTDRYVTITPKSSSKVPRINLFIPDLQTFTSGSKVRVFAQADDIDGSLEEVRFYVNGEPVGDAVPAYRGKGSSSYPYSFDWEVPEAGTYSFFATAQDNSGNGVMSNISTITATTGSGLLPEVSFNSPLRVAEARLPVDNKGVLLANALDENGSILGIELISGGFGYMVPPQVQILSDGSGFGATAFTSIETNASLPTYGQVTKVEITNGGSGYDENTSIRLLGGFPLIKPGGKPAVVEVELRAVAKQGDRAEFTDGQTFGQGFAGLFEWQPVFYVIEGGSGYVEPPEVIIRGLGTGMTAEAVIENGRLIEVNPTNNGTGYFQTGNSVTLEGGFPIEMKSFTADVSDADGAVTEVTLFVNGSPLQVDSFAPYQFEWPSGPEGIYDIYLQATDSQGNKNLSSIMRREVFLSQDPILEIQPVSIGMVLQPSLQASTLLIGDQNVEGLSFPEGNLSIEYAGSNYHTAPRVHFYDPEGNGSGATGHALISNGKLSQVVVDNGGFGYSENSEVRLVGGLETTLHPIRLKHGYSMPIGVYAFDPDTMINPLAFSVEINGELSYDLNLTGADPYFSFIWTPNYPGDFDLRIHGATVDGSKVSSQILDVEVYHDSDNSVELIYDESAMSLRHAVGNMIHLPFRIDSDVGTIDEIIVFDNGEEVARHAPTAGQFSANVIYEAGAKFFDFVWTPNYEGVHKILVAIKLQSGLYFFSESYDLEVIEGISISIAETSTALQTEVFHMQDTTVEVDVSITHGKVPQFSQALLYGNGILLQKLKFFRQNSQPPETPTQFDLDENRSGATKIINYDYEAYANKLNWSFDWRVNYKDFKDAPDLFNRAKVDLSVVALTRPNQEMSMVGRILESEPKPALVRKLNLHDPKSAIAMYYKDLTGNHPNDYVTSDIVSNLEEEAEQQQIIELMVNYTMGSNFNRMAEIIAAHKVLYGHDHASVNSFFTEFNEWSDNPLGYILMHLRSAPYTSQYGLIYEDRPHFFGSTEGQYFSVRSEFVNRHFQNKYNKKPFTVQSLSGGKKMWDFWNANGGSGSNNFELNILAAADFIINLATERTVQLGVNGQISQTYLPHMEAHNSLYMDKAKIYSLLRLFPENDEVDTDSLEVSVIEKNQLSIDESIEEYLSDKTFEDFDLSDSDDPALKLLRENINQRFNLLWENSEQQEEFPSWKYEDWFGHFMDKNFPWIYHVDLGWVYSTSSSQQNIWLYSEGIGWFWTNREIFKDHPNLDTDERFIFRVRPGSSSGWEGSWSLITLPQSGSNEILLYDYGYQPF